METQPITIRNITPEEFFAWEQVMGVAFGFDPRPEDSEAWKKRAEFDRYLAAFDGEEMVGTGGAVTFAMTVPGGAAVTLGGVTAIATRPTHRRRGDPDRDHAPAAGRRPGAAERRSRLCGPRRAPSTAGSASESPSKDAI